MEYGKEYDELFELKVKYFDEDMVTGTLVYDHGSEYNLTKLTFAEFTEKERIADIVWNSTHIKNLNDKKELLNELDRVETIVKHKEYANKMKEFLDTYYKRLIFRFNPDKDLIIDLIAENLYKDKKIPILVNKPLFFKNGSKFRYKMIYPYVAEIDYVLMLQKILNRIIEYNNTVMITYKFSPKLADVKITFG